MYFHWGNRKWVVICYVIARKENFLFRIICILAGYIICILCNEGSTTPHSSEMSLYAEWLKPYQTQNINKVIAEKLQISKSQRVRKSFKWFLFYLLLNILTVNNKLQDFCNTCCWVVTSLQVIPTTKRQFGNTNLTKTCLWTNNWPWVSRKNITYKMSMIVHFFYHNQGEWSTAQGL